jgi:hypothetical protein
MTYKTLSIYSILHNVLSEKVTKNRVILRKCIKTLKLVFRCHQKTLFWAIFTKSIHLNFECFRVFLIARGRCNPMALLLSPPPSARSYCTHISSQFRAQKALCMPVLQTVHVKCHHFSSQALGGPVCKTYVHSRVRHHFCFKAKQKLNEVKTKQKRSVNFKAKKDTVKFWDNL